jgi:hypothetical protein
MAAMERMTALAMTVLRRRSAKFLGEWWVVETIKKRRKKRAVEVEVMKLSTIWGREPVLETKCAKVRRAKGAVKGVIVKRKDLAVMFPEGKEDEE